MASGPFTLVRLADAAGMSVDEVRMYRDRYRAPRGRLGRVGDSLGVPATDRSDGESASAFCLG
jgi:hypothetical protein